MTFPKEESMTLVFGTGSRAQSRNFQGAFFHSSHTTISTSVICSLRLK